MLNNNCLENLSVWTKIYSYWIIITEVMQNITEVGFFLTTVYDIKNNIGHFTLGIPANMLRYAHNNIQSKSNRT